MMLNNFKSSIIAGLLNEALFLKGAKSRMMFRIALKGQEKRVLKAICSKSDFAAFRRMIIYEAISPFINQCYCILVQVYADIKMISP